MLIKVKLINYWMQLWTLITYNNFYKKDFVWYERYVVLTHYVIVFVDSITYFLCDLIKVNYDWNGGSHGG